jgi:hypothetical protein
VLAISNRITGHGDQIDGILDTPIDRAEAKRRLGDLTHPRSSQTTRRYRGAWPTLTARVAPSAGHGCADSAQAAVPSEGP